MNFTELTYKLLTGEWRVDRERIRKASARNQLLANRDGRERYYSSAQQGPDRPTPSQLSTPEDYKQSYDRIVLIRGARQLEEDFPFFDGILWDFETYVVGDLNFIPATGRAEADTVIRDFLEWQFDQVDISERWDLTKLARLWIRSHLRDGECGGIILDRGDGIRLNSVSGDRIGNPLVGANIGPRNFNGIIVNEATSAPSIFQIYKRLPKLNSYVFERDVPAGQFIHYFNPFRIEQYHGVTLFMNSISRAYDLEQIHNFTRLNMKFRSSQLPYVTNAQGRPRGLGYEQPVTNATGQEVAPQTIKVDGVTQTFLKVGEATVEYPNDFPNQQFLPAVMEIQREIAYGAKLPLEFCFRSDAGGVVQRFYVDKAQGTFDEHKRWLRRCLLNPIKNRIIQHGIETGLLNLSRFGDLGRSLNRFRGQWQMGRPISSDYGREIDADLKQIEGGVLSPQDYMTSAGRDPEVVRRQVNEYTKQLIEDAKEISDKTGVPLETVLPYLSKRFPNQQPAEPGSKAGEEEVRVEDPAGRPTKRKPKAALVDA